jgi:hypothetical protein
MGRTAQLTEPRTESATKAPVKTAVTLSADAHRRLETAALVDDKSYSEIVDDLIKTHLTGYYAGRRAKASGSDSGDDE